VKPPTGLHRTLPGQAKLRQRGLSSWPTVVLVAVMFKQLIILMVKEFTTGWLSENPMAYGLFHVVDDRQNFE
jgi:hypothetical protein